MPPLRIGALGASAIAPSSLFAPARAVDGVEVSAVAARDPARAQAYATRHGIGRTHPSYDALLADPDLDAVYIGLPNSLHCEWAIKALRAGKHVLCEKPLASNADEARRMAAAADAANRQLMEAFHWRYHDLSHRMIQLVRDGEIGTLRHVEASLCVPVLSGSDIRYNLGLGGGAMMDVGAYTVSWLRHLADEEPVPTSATATLASAGIDRLMEAELAYPSGATGWMRASLYSWRLLSMWSRVIGDRGEIYAFNPIAPQFGLAKLRIRTPKGRRTERFRLPSTYEAQLRAFLAAIRSGAPALTDGWDGAQNMDVIDAVYRAAGMNPRG